MGESLRTHYRYSTSQPQKYAKEGFPRGGVPLIYPLSSSYKNNPLKKAWASTEARDLKHPYLHWLGRLWVGGPHPAEGTCRASHPLSNWRSCNGHTGPHGGIIARGWLLVRQVPHSLMWRRKLTIAYVTISVGNARSEFFQDCLKNTLLKYNLFISGGLPVFNTFFFFLAVWHTLEMLCFLWKRTFWKLFKIHRILDSFSRLYFIYSLAVYLTHGQVTVTVNERRILQHFYLPNVSGGTWVESFTKGQYPRWQDTPSFFPLSKQRITLRGTFISNFRSYRYRASGGNLSCSLGCKHGLLLQLSAGVFLSC